jgi:hypothetical protein
MNSGDRRLLPAAEQREIAAALDRTAGVSPATKRTADHRRLAAVRQQPATEFEMTGFWGEPGGDAGERLKAGRFKVKLRAPMASVVP